MAADSFAWQCPTCSHDTTITRPNYTSQTSSFYCRSERGARAILLRGLLIECPNAKCHAQFFRVNALHGTVVETPQGGIRVQANTDDPVGVGEFVFLPTTAQPLSEYVPAAVREDYQEAYLIRQLSPKASATLARRALQGMIRDFWGVSMRTLHHELEAIRDRCEGELYAAMMAMKSIGNIGAHPERDVSQIVEIEPDEPQALLDLVHLLDKEWYVARASSRARIARVQALAATKDEARARPS